MNPLDNLNDIVVPDTVNAWPLAWGWWVAISVLLLVMVAIWTWVLKRKRLNAAKKKALSLLDKLHKSETLSLSDANEILKRISLSYCSRENVAALHGEKWVAFLKQHIKSSKRKEPWVEDLNFFSNHQYKSDTNIGSDDIYTVTIHWIKAADLKHMQNYVREPHSV